MDILFIPWLEPIDIPADLILPIFLPSLLWALARRTNWAVIRSQLFTVVSLSVLLVLATIAAVAGTTYLLLPSVGIVAAVEMNSRLKVGAEDRLSGGAFWETIEMMFTGVAFGLIGLNVRDAIETVGADLWHAVWVIALMVLLCTMVIPGLTLPWLLFQLDLDHGPDAAGDEAREALIRRGRRAAVEEIYRHADELTPQFLSAVEHWVTEESDIRAEHPEDEHHDAEDEQHGKEENQDKKAHAERIEKMIKQREKANHVRFLSLKATQQELLIARREPGVDPVIVDELLKGVDRMLMAAKQDIKIVK